MADMPKFKTLVHYVCSQSPNRLSLGKTKLNKILWFAEREAYLRSGKPISGVKFIKLPYGPVPEVIDEVLGQLEVENALFVRNSEWNGRPKKDFISRREPSLSGFTSEEVSIINKAISTICNEHTATSISKKSHDEIWELAEIGEELPLYAAFGRPGELRPEDALWARAQLAQMESEAAVA